MQNHKERKLKIVVIAEPVFIRLFAQGSKHAFDVLAGLPEDAELVDATFNQRDYRLELLVYSEAFKEVPANDQVPELMIVAKEIEITDLTNGQSSAE